MRLISALGREAEMRGRRAAGRAAGLALSLALVLVARSPLRADTTVVFHEIHYHPAVDEAAHEWVELHNSLAVDIDVSGWSIDGGVRYPIPEGTIIPGGGYLVVARSPDTLRAEGVRAEILGPFDGRFDNSGERLELLDRNGRTMDRVRYRDGGAWPVGPDGSGATLAKRDPELSSAPARNWTTSARVGGTPGEANFPREGGPPSLPTGLVSYWSFDEPSGSLVDPVGSNHGTTGAAATREEGLVGPGAIGFDDSVHAYVNVGTGVGDSFSMTDGISIEALIVSTWSSASGDEDTIFRKEDGPWRILLALQHDGDESDRDVPISPAEQPVLAFGIRVNGVYSELDMPFDGAAGRPTLGDLKDGSPHHIAATYDAATGVKAIWFDGERVFWHQFPAGSPMESGGTTSAYIGNMSGRRRPMRGLLDEVAIWRSALSASEVAHHAANAAAGRDYFSAESEVTETPAFGFNEYATSGPDAPWVEVVHFGAEALDTEGLEIAVAGSARSPRPLPAVRLEPGELLLLTAADIGGSFRPGDRLFLLAGDGDVVLDGVRIEADDRARHPAGTGRWLLPEARTPGAPNEFALRDEIVIHEIHYHPRLLDGSTEPPESWIELLNRSDGPVDIGGWRLDDAVDYVFEEGTVLGPGELLVVAEDRDHLRLLHPDARIVGSFEKQLSNSEDEIVLLDAGGNPADEVHYRDDLPWPRYADGRGSSLELLDPFADNSVPEAWAASIEETRSEWKTYVYRSTASAGVGPANWNELVIGLLDAGEILIDDIHVVERPDTAPVEFLQNGDFESGASAWRLLGNHRHSRVVEDPDRPGEHVLHLVAVGPTEHMHNHLETTFRGGERVANGREYEISFRAKWLAGSNQLNTRLYFNRVARTTRIDVPRTNGTPGAPNSVGSGNIGPTFSSLEQQPVVPDAGEDIDISIAVEDPDGVTSVELRWRTSGGSWSTIPMEEDEPTGRWQASIPGQPRSTLLQLYVAASDTAGATTHYPPAGPDSRALVRVEDGQAGLGPLHNLRILMLPEDAEFMHRSTNVMSNEWLPSTVVYDERTVYYRAFVRLKGSERGRPVSGRVGFHLKFPSDQLYRGVHETLHVDRSGGWKFGGPDGQDEIIIKHMVNRAGGIPGMQDDIVRVIAPRSAQTGPALLMMAAFSDVYLDSRWENGGDGQMYKLELIYYPTTTTDGNPESLKRPQPDGVVGTDIRNLGSDKEAYRWNFLIENHRVADDYTPIIELGRAFSLPSSQLHEGTKDVIDVDEWMRTFTIYSLCGINDTYTQGNNHNNIYWRRPSDGKMLVFPWDMDFSWVRSTSSPLWGDQNLGRIIALPPNRRVFYGHMLDVIEKAYNTEYMGRWIEHYGDLAEEDYSSILSYMVQRRSYVLGRIPSRVPFAITTESGRDHTVNAIRATLEGTAWFDVVEIWRAGETQPLDLTWSTESRWSTSVELDAGANPIDIVGFGHDGDIVGIDRITITSSFGFPRPSIEAVAPPAAFPGDLVEIEGAGFRSDSKVLFGDEESPEVMIESAARIRAEVPDAPGGRVSLSVLNSDGRSSEPALFTIHEGGRFIRGDTNLDEVVDVSDAIRLLLHLYGGMPLLCEDAGDVHEDESLDLTDAVNLLTALFQGGAPPPPPYPTAGTDPDEGPGLGCGE